MMETLKDEQLREVLKGMAMEAGGQSALAKSFGVTPQYVCDLLRGRRTFSEFIANKMGYSRVFVKKSIPEQEEDNDD